MWVAELEAWTETDPRGDGAWGRKGLGAPAVQIHQLEEVVVAGSRRSREWRSDVLGGQLVMKVLFFFLTWMNVLFGRTEVDLFGVGS
jgi:hypothetical protein